MISMPVASPGPRFVAVIVNFTGLPSIAVVVSTVLVSPISASVSTWVEKLSPLLALWPLALTLRLPAIVPTVSSVSAVPLLFVVLEAGLTARGRRAARRAGDDQRLGE